MNIRETVESVLLQHFLKEKKTFSAHNVTQFIRDALQRDEFQIKGIAEYVLVDGKKVQRISHEDVRDFVTEFMNKQSTYTSNMVTEKGHTFRQYQYKRQAPTPHAEKAPANSIKGENLLI